MTTTTDAASTTTLCFDDVVGACKRRFADFAEAGHSVFTTDADDLYERFLAALPAERRQHYTCRACARHDR